MGAHPPRPPAPVPRAARLVHRLPELAFFVDGPLAVFGHPAWLSARISPELKRLNAARRASSPGTTCSSSASRRRDLRLSLRRDRQDRDSPGASCSRRGSFFMPSDQYIKSRIIFSSGPKRYGEDTYFGRKVFYKTASGARIVADIPFLNDEQDTLDDDDPGPLPAARYHAGGCSTSSSPRGIRMPFARSCHANAQAAIPLHLGAKVLQQLARALVQDASP